MMSIYKFGIKIPCKCFASTADIKGQHKQCSAINWGASYFCF